MKHYYYSIFIFIFIISTAIFSSFYIHSYVDETTILIENISNNNSIQRLNIVKENFFKQKNILQLFVSKEYISDLEKNINLLEHYIKNEDAVSCQEKVIEITNLLKEIKIYSLEIN